MAGSSCLDVSEAQNRYVGGDRSYILLLLVSEDRGPWKDANQDVGIPHLMSIRSANAWQSTPSMDQNPTVAVHLHFAGILRTATLGKYEYNGNDNFHLSLFTFLLISTLCFDSSYRGMPCIYFLIFASIFHFPN